MIIINILNRFFTDLFGHDFDEIDIGNGDNTMYTVSAVYLLQSNILFNSYHYPHSVRG